jgi:FAD/FMN-containing dehydrogenase
MNQADHELRACFRGPIHLPGDPGYDDQRATWSGAIDPRPAIVAEALTPADVQNAVLIARRHGLRFAVQSTGHGTLVPADGGLLLKTSRMAEVLVDPDRRVARVGAGAVWSQVITAAAPFGLAPVAGSAPGVGVAGYTLGGGVGWLSRRFGFAADSLLRAQVVTADGHLLTASADQNPDLFWALRGAGANFGVVTSLEVRLHRVAQVFGGVALFPVDSAPRTIACLRDYAAAAPDELYVSLVVMREAPDPSLRGPVLAIRGVYAGEPDDAVRAMWPLWQAAGTPLRDGFRPMSYPETGAIGGTPPRHFELLEDLSDSAIAAIVEAAGTPESPARAVEVRHWGGAMANPGPGARPGGHPADPSTVTNDGDPDAAAPLVRLATGGSFLNFLGDTRRTAAAWTAADLERLRELKRRYDPGNVFGSSHNVSPASGVQTAAADHRLEEGR